MPLLNGLSVPRPQCGRPHQEKAPALASKLGRCSALAELAAVASHSSLQEKEIAPCTSPVALLLAQLEALLARTRHEAEVLQWSPPLSEGIPDCGDARAEMITGPLQAEEGSLFHVEFRKKLLQLLEKECALLAQSLQVLH
mmetsp:Transcript_22235/g.42717  ORF Transcript_22235/g.42717 Transcript_22235/m.42717 type:complete len:141 (+) Transcript_22235:262-684(+)